MDVRKLFFSKNEKFIVMITQNQAIVIEVTDASFDVVQTIELEIPTPPEVIKPKRFVYLPT